MKTDYKKLLGYTGILEIDTLIKEKINTEIKAFKMFPGSKKQIELINKIVELISKINTLKNN